MAHSFDSQSHYYNLRWREYNFQVEDRVMKRQYFPSSGMKGFSLKLAPKYVGPYSIIKVVSPVILKLKDDLGNICENVHVKHGKLTV
ncbi:hypothetical protein NQ314_001849 [Rhamnusium bicolor]|uniref:Uncharacterized protein n=1 Tax=Rhamnusium bicolor TaxID=1586634 RepID=A0AAV8ZT22_9CUCU|nr:hypothetical protein NQ314_001849 [Rhamnusium bicolor]